MDIESSSEFSEFTDLSIEQARIFMSDKEEHYKEIYKAIAGLVHKMGGSVLDIGCGKGISVNLYGKDEYTGIDISPNLVMAAQENNPGYNFKVANGLQLPFSDKSFDSVICKSYFEHLHSEEQAVQAMKEAVRVCKRQLLIAWHTPPAYITTHIVKMKGNFDRDIYQNRYNILAIMRTIPKKARQNLEVGQVEVFQLWRILL